MPCQSVGRSVDQQVFFFVAMCVYNFTLCSSKTDVTCCACVCVFFLSVSRDDARYEFGVVCPRLGRNSAMQFVAVAVWLYSYFVEVFTALFDGTECSKWMRRCMMMLAGNP